MAQVSLEKIYKRFPPSGKRKTGATNSQKTQQQQSSGTTVLRSVDLTIADGEFMVLVGPSGCGKSTLLRLIAGLDSVTGGQIWIGDRLINNLPPKQRDIAMVFQNYALYPHLNVYDNLAFGLRRMMRGDQAQTQRFRGKIYLQNSLTALTRSLPSALRYRSPQEKIIREKVYQSAQLLQIDHLLSRLPKELSGGQKQRVALGRAISRDPQVFLMDEPLSNLDAKLRAETRSQIVQLQRQLNTTTIYVTHDQTEAMTMGDRIAVMNQGKLLQIAPPLEIYERPANRFVAEFIGSPPMNFLEMELNGDRLYLPTQGQIPLPPSWQEELFAYQRQTLLVGIRPDHLQLTDGDSAHLQAEVEMVEALGNETYLSLMLTGDLALLLKARIAPEIPVKMGEILSFALPLPKLHLFDLHSEERIATPDF